MSDRNPVYNLIPFMQGDTWTMTVQVTDNNGAAKDLTDYTAKLQIRERASSVALLSLTHASGIAITPATGTLVITITATQSAAFTFNKAKYALQITSGAGIVTTILHGDVEIISRIAQ